MADCLEEDALAITPTGQFCNVHEQVLVCVSTYSTSVQLLRRGARIADYMNARLYTLFVADPDRFLTKEESFYIETCEKLCQEFGGEFLRVTSQNVPRAIAEVAEKYHVTQIVMGESQRSRWKLLLQGSFTQQLMQLIRDKNIDLHIIATNNKSPK